MRERSTGDFDHVLKVCEQLAADLPGHVFIGGIAVYLHAVQGQHRRQVEVSHDADVMISLADLSTLRDDVEVVSNRRLGKHQVIVDGVDVDVYVERQHGLAVPYDDLLASASKYGLLRAAAPEHLLVLKLCAYADRRGSAKGDKDARDLVRILTLGKHWRSELGEPYLSAEYAGLLREISRSTVFHDMCNRNVHEAQKLRTSFIKRWKTIA
jgi:hypothetical protein